MQVIVYFLELKDQMFYTRQDCIGREMVCLVWLLVFNVTFNNISVISWRLVLLVQETRVPGENHRPVSSH